MTPRPLLLRARTVVPDPASSIDDGAVLIHDGRVARVGRFSGDLDKEPARVHDLGDVALLPGLVNAHAHLDLTGARGRLDPTDDFAGWIRRMPPLREELRPDVGGAAEEGARELLAGGCTLVADIVAERAAVEGLRRAGIRAVVFHEVIAFPAVEPRPLEAAVAAAADVREDGTLKPGLAPHTPYTCTPDVLARTAAEGRRRDWPLTVHVAETPGERAWLERGEGPLAVVLEAFCQRSTVPGRSGVGLLADAGVLDRPALLAHGNDLSAAEMTLLRDRGATVVHCPGSHAFFGHPQHPVADLRAAGVPVAIGTDGLVSHPDHALSVPGELRRLAARCPDIPPRDLLAMATTVGAAGLGLAGRAGALLPGALADLAAFTCPGGWRGPSSLLDPDLRCLRTWVGGVERHRDPASA